MRSALSLSLSLKCFWVLKLVRTKDWLCCCGWVGVGQYVYIIICLYVYCLLAAVGEWVSASVLFFFFLIFIFYACESPFWLLCFVFKHWVSARFPFIYLFIYYFFFICLIGDTLTLCFVFIHFIFREVVGQCTCIDLFFFLLNCFNELFFTFWLNILWFVWVLYYSVWICEYLFYIYLRL